MGRYFDNCVSAISVADERRGYELTESECGSTCDMESSHCGTRIPSSDTFTGTCERFVYGDQGFKADSPDDWQERGPLLLPRCRRTRSDHPDQPSSSSARSGRSRARDGEDRGYGASAGIAQGFRADAEDQQDQDGGLRRGARLAECHPDVSAGNPGIQVSMTMGSTTKSQY